MEKAEQQFLVESRSSKSPMTEDEAMSCMREFDAAIPTLGDEFSSRVFDQPQGTRCRMLANFGAGYDHIDVGAAKASGVVVTNTPGAVTESTADIALALMLMVARRTVEGDRLVRGGGWTGWHPTQLLGEGVHGRTLGIIGLGRIGRAVARRCANGFDMNVVFANRSRVPDAEPVWIQRDSAIAVAAEADFLVVAVSGGQGSHHIVNADIFNHMKPGAFLINVSRGTAVEEAALVDALRSGQIAGAGLDVYEFEPRIPDALLGMENVVLLPHLGTALLNVREAMGEMALDNLLEFFAGREPPNRVT